VIPPYNSNLTILGEKQDGACGNPAKSIPWRDHWLQAVYYLPTTRDVCSGDPVFLKACHDEFSFSFSLNCNEKTEAAGCRCGFHMMTSRTRLAAINDPERLSIYKNIALDLVKLHKYFIVLGDFTMLGFILDKAGADKVLLLAQDSSGLLKNTYHNFTDGENSITVMHSMNSVVEELRKISTSANFSSDQVCIIGEPYFSDSVLPWDNRRFYHMAEEVLKLSKDFLLEYQVAIFPEKISVKGCCVQFDDLWKISRPVGTCLGFDVHEFDVLIRAGENKCFATPEPQPLWEYPCVCLSSVEEMVEVTRAGVNVVDVDFGPLKMGRCDGVAVWADYQFGNGHSVTTGPLSLGLGNYIKWVTHDMQGVHFFEPPLEPNSKSVIYKFPSMPPTR